jgi:hypothetical protein
VARDAELYQAKLLVVAVEAVRFGINRDAIDGLELRKQGRELGICLDHFLNPTPLRGNPKTQNPKPK